MEVAKKDAIISLMGIAPIKIGHKDDKKGIGMRLPRNQGGNAMGL